MGDLEVDDFVLKPEAARYMSVSVSLLRCSHLLLVRRHIPFSKARDTFFEFASSLKFGVGNGQDVYLGQGMADERSEVFGEIPKGVVATLEQL